MKINNNNEQTVNEVNGRKSTLRVKLKTAIQEERFQKWKEHFKNLLGKPPEIIDKPIQKIINEPLDIKLRQFTEKELDAVLKKIKAEKLQTSMKYLQKFQKQENLATYFFNYAILCIIKTQRRNGQKAASSFPQVRKPWNH